MAASLTKDAVVRKYTEVFYNPKIVRLLSLIKDEHFSATNTSDNNPFTIVSSDESLDVFKSQLNPLPAQTPYSKPYTHLVKRGQGNDNIRDKMVVQNAFLEAFFTGILGINALQQFDFPNARAFSNTDKTQAVFLVPTFRIVQFLAQAQQATTLLQYLPKNDAEFGVLQHKMETVLRMFHTYMLSAEKTRAFLRIRCDTPDQHRANTVVVEGFQKGDLVHRGKSVTVVDTSDGGLRLPNYAYGPFDAVFVPEATNTAIANELRESMLEELNDHPLVLIAYGASGSGKTSTLIQLKNGSQNEDGVAFMLGTPKEITYTEYKADGARTEIDLQNATDVQEKLANERETKATPNNPISSRSHVVVKLMFEGVENALYVCDFAGIEAQFACDDWHVHYRLQITNWVRETEHNELDDKVTEERKNMAINTVDCFQYEQDFILFVEQPTRCFFDLCRGCLLTLHSSYLQVAETYDGNRNYTQQTGVSILLNSRDQMTLFDRAHPEFKEKLKELINRHVMWDDGSPGFGEWAGVTSKRDLTTRVAGAHMNQKVPDLFRDWDIGIEPSVRNRVKANHKNINAQTAPIRYKDWKFAPLKTTDCDALNTEGNFIRLTLGELNGLISGLFEAKSRGAVYPAPPFDDVCFESYCYVESPWACFPKPISVTPPAPPSQLARDLATIIKGGGAFALFGVVNVSDNLTQKFAYLPPNVEPEATLRTKYPSSDWSAVRNLSVFNAPSLRGSLDFMQKCITFMHTEAVCPMPLNSSYTSVLERSVTVKTSERESDDQFGGGVVYPASVPEMARWAGVATVASGAALLVARRALSRPRPRGQPPRDLPGALIAQAAAYSLTVALLAAVAGLDRDAASAFGPVRVALHLSAYWLAVAAAHALARRRPDLPIERFSAALYAASMAAIVIV